VFGDCREMGGVGIVGNRMSATIEARRRLRTMRGIGGVGLGIGADGTRLSSCRHWWLKSGDEWRWDQRISHGGMVIRIPVSRVFVVVQGFWRDDFARMTSDVQGRVEGEQGPGCKQRQQSSAVKLETHLLM
jgi:hypothetical protein